MRPRWRCGSRVGGNVQAGKPVHALRSACFQRPYSSSQAIAPVVARRRRARWPGVGRCVGQGRSSRPPNGAERPVTRDGRRCGASPRSSERRSSDTPAASPGSASSSIPVSEAPDAGSRLVVIVAVPPYGLPFRATVTGNTRSGHEITGAPNSPRQRRVPTRFKRLLRGADDRGRRAAEAWPGGRPAHSPWPWRARGSRQRSRSPSARRDSSASR